MGRSRTPRTSTALKVMSIWCPSRCDRLASSHFRTNLPLPALMLLTSTSARRAEGSWPICGANIMDLCPKVIALN